MPHTICIKAAPDRVLRHPDTMTALPPEGEQVLWSSYWQRRLDEGDALLVPDVVEPAEAAKQAKKDAKA